MSEPDTLLTSLDIAKRLNMTARHVSMELRKTPGFPAPYRIGRSLRWDRNEFEQWLQQQKLPQQQPRIHPIGRRKA